MTRHLLVPGRGAPRPEHWLSRWARANPDYRWASEPTGPPFVLADRVVALHAAVTTSGEATVLIAHSAGCITVAAWAARYGNAGTVHAALLIAPPYLDPRRRPGPDDPGDLRHDMIPRRPLPFRTVLVASRTDPYTSYEQFEQYAADWGSQLYDAGDAGHLETASGYGPWPAGERLVASLA
ncbi:RBBP9/YdeN family alpha/beta hydrolase [Solwaraspora sp. WMMB335]|uniref:RBBP9/YdeN family alpha/beta hydrolase n=1 Tax=Solwaraspora sp. WMMB335 TaxID=3404118 RepID=UPI003B95DDD0